MFYNFRKNKLAFTLVELIVVIAIIAILGAVVGVTVSTFVNRARKTAATTPLTELADKWSMKEDATTLKAYIAELFPNDKGNFKIATGQGDRWGETGSNKNQAAFTIYYHDSNCGDYWGVLSVGKGWVFDKKNVDSTTTAPTNPVNYPS